MRNKPEEYHHEERHLRLVPDWAERERRTDLDWIEDHLLLCRAAVLDYYRLYGRGALVIDTTIDPEVHDEGLLWYLPFTELQSLDETAVQDLVEAYDPAREMVIVLLKHGTKQNLYCITLPPAFPNIN
jgi:hypothetical protein